MGRINRFVNSLVTVSVLTALLIPFVAAAQSSAAPIAYAQTDQSTVVVKLKAGAEAELAGNSFSSTTASVKQLNQILTDRKATNTQSLLPESRQTVKTRHQQTNLPTNRGDLENYYTIKLPAGQKADDVAAALKALDVVETAYAKPLPAPAPTTPSYVSAQNYLKAAPTGMGVSATIGGSTAAYPGTNGGGVNVADLEYSWNTSHEDLSRLRALGAVWANGTPVDPFADTNHGTAVAGVIAADKNVSGVDGIVAATNYKMVNTNTAERGWDVAGSIYLAANKMTAGDIILLEQQAWAPDYQGFAPIETYQDVYDAIVYATAKGINVVEPAGNGKQNIWQGYDLSDPQFQGIFTTTRVNSGALIIGAGGAGCSTTPLRARMAFSNYGTRVDAQGYGECVTTTGYGNLSNVTINAAYTSTFNGTSSASATIAGVVAELSASYKQTNSKAMTTTGLKNALISGGSAQNTTVAGKIGVLPNMAIALRYTDITKPSVPTGLTATVSTGKVSLKWNAASDNLGYVKYVVYRNNVKIATISSTNYNDYSVHTRTNYTYKVAAIDASANQSAYSNAVTIRTLN